jgi:hypothetical protein
VKLIPIIEIRKVTKYKSIIVSSLRVDMLHNRYH